MGQRVLSKWQELIIATIAGTLPMFLGAGLAMILWHMG
jgi:hypothetical protein